MSAEQKIFDEALEAGKKAWAECTPTPMVVGEAKSLFSSGIDYSKPTYYVADGVCGFAWVTIKPARGKFVSWLKKNKIGRTGTYGGWMISSNVNKSDFSQSMQRKEAFCEAFAKVLRNHGLNAYAESRLD